MSGLKLDGEGRYLVEPKIGIVAALVAEGAVRLARKPRKFPLGEGRQLVAVGIFSGRDAGLWITDPEDFADVQGFPAVVWLDVPNAPLFEADREPLQLGVDSAHTRIEAGPPSPIGGPL